MSVETRNKTTKRYRAQTLVRKHPKKYTLDDIRKSADNKPKDIADLEWQIKFTKMKLGLWRDLEKDNWVVLEDMHKQAKQKLKESKTAYFG